MPLFHYKAVTEPGELIEGDMEALDQAAVVEHLRALGYLPLRAERQATGSLAGWLGRELGRRRGLSRQSVTAIVRELSTLLGAGLALDQALQVLIEFSDKESVGELLKRVLDRVRDGVSLSEAMSAQGGVFDRFCIGMVRAGEAGGSLDTTLAKTAEYMERSHESKQKLKSALIYPSILLVAAALSVVIVMTVVIPSFKDIFEQAGMQLPLVTRVVLAIGEIAQQFWWLPLLAALVAILVVGRQRRDPVGRRTWDRRILRLPLLGDVFAKSEVARVSYTLGMLLSNGVSMLQALSVAKETLGNAAMAFAFEQVEGEVKEGRTLSGPLEDTQLFPRHAIHLLRIGEESGRLEDMLFRLASMYETEVQHLTQRLMTLLLPVITLALALLIAGIIISVMVPMLSLHQLAF